ncbi:hypothetical protein B9Z55_019225 [Caenorhabditis nigoni]|uniref:Uncharacterized protein n=1 Tax=Caenorhabditis nigoni TaxID=1611254 RepID=A0A2G5THG6_9PELO|nr:hypothetical protein B9Z55_019225 [Caenorhabditis nigoni]
MWHNQKKKQKKVKTTRGFEPTPCAYWRHTHPRHHPADISTMSKRRLDSRTSLNFSCGISVMECVVKHANQRNSVLKLRTEITRLKLAGGS